MAYLKDKIVKVKKLQKLSKSLVLVMPANWLEEMGWNRNTKVQLSWHPEEDKIIIKKAEVQDEEVSQSESEEH